MEIVGEFLRIDADKGIGNYFRGHWQELFPEIKSRSAFVRRGLERLLTYGAMSSSYSNFWRES
ncbi:hypothetical protein [Myxosarcina sp. GI1]|uniref:hypothetical protein n=1 Tax=Myxosarcina sp. GI1 TaxID=1541065 RepID=UPI0012E05B27|nr:hypothetical protein [Myxosarcina sp. GI1]